MTATRHSMIDTDAVVIGEQAGHRFECPICLRRLILWTRGEQRGIEIEEAGDQDVEHSGALNMSGIEANVE